MKNCKNCINSEKQEFLDNNYKYYCYQGDFNISDVVTQAKKCECFEGILTVDIAKRYEV